MQRIMIFGRFLIPAYPLVSRFKAGPSKAALGFRGRKRENVEIRADGHEFGKKIISWFCDGKKAKCVYPVYLAAKDGNSNSPQNSILYKNFLTAEGPALGNAFFFLPRDQ